MNVHNYSFFSYFFVLVFYVIIRFIVGVLLRLDAIARPKSRQWQLYFDQIQKNEFLIILCLFFYRIQEMVCTSAGFVIEFCSRSLAEIPAEGSHHSDHALLHHGHLSNCFPAGHEVEWNNLGGLVDSSIPASHGVCPRSYGK